MRACTAAPMRARAAGSPAWVMAPSIHSAIEAMSAGPSPRVVTAGVPMRMPLVTNGDCVSNGTMFLFTVMCAAPRAASACFPVTPLLRRSMSIRWLSVPPLTKS